jgi:hypothetical protein
MAIPPRSPNVGFPIRTFIDVPAADTLDAMNALVRDTNAYLALFARGLPPLVSTVAALPTAAVEGQRAWALDGRKVGEQTGFGSGVEVYYSSGTWRVLSTDAPVMGSDNLRTWTGICADSKLLVSWLVGGRDSGYAIEFMDDLRSRLAHRVQPDGHKSYLEAVEGAFGGDVDYAQLVKLYGPTSDSAKGRYSPAECTGIKKTPIEGKPDPRHISTSFVERQNLTMRMRMRRFTRLTNAFSKKLDNHVHALALYLVHYNWMRIHKSLQTGLATKLS